jgi:hypothetical protein
MKPLQARSQAPTNLGSFRMVRDDSAATANRPKTQAKNARVWPAPTRSIITPHKAAPTGLSACAMKR